MGFYAKHILPHVIDLAMRNPAPTRLRAEWIPRATGDVLEVGIGSGLNLAFYTDQVRRVYGLDPSQELQQMARERAGKLPVQVDFMSQSAERPIPLPPDSIETVVLTWTLRCVSIKMRHTR
ncbi:MAG TPA: class I SAM-dependent methyltransferase [Candidatus Paceibacterota bacterium]|nr:class I SAM-dependent methyltransferase [Candidatus Paceibacterota bacterium]